jgi:hypothetical protein
MAASAAVALWAACKRLDKEARAPRSARADLDIKALAT